MIDYISTPTSQRLLQQRKHATIFVPFEHKPKLIHFPR